MNFFRNHLKVRQVRVLTRIAVIIVLFEINALAAMSGETSSAKIIPPYCSDLMAKILILKDHWDARVAAREVKLAKKKTQKAAVEARKKAEEEIRKTLTKEIRPLAVDQVLLTYYREYPEEREAFFKEMQLRKDRGLTTAKDDLTAYALASEEAFELVQPLLDRKNIFIRYDSALSGIHLFDSRRIEASVTKSSYLSFLIHKIFMRKYPRPGSFIVTLQRQILARPEDDLSFFTEPNTHYQTYLDSIGRSLYIAKIGSDPGATGRDRWTKTAALIAAGKAYWGIGAQIDYEGNGYQPVKEILKELILRMYPTALEIANSREDVVSLVQKPELLNQLTLDMNQRAILNGSGPKTYINDLISQTAKREVPRSFLRGITKTTLFFIVIRLAKNIVIGFFPAGSGEEINGVNIPGSVSCNPAGFLAEDKGTVMNDNPDLRPIYPFLPVFIGPVDGKYPGWKKTGPINPCDPDGQLASAFKKISGEHPDNDDDNAANNPFLVWEGKNPAVIAAYRKELRDHFQYTDPKHPSACATYYNWFMHCGPGFKEEPPQTAKDSSGTRPRSK